MFAFINSSDTRASAHVHSTRMNMFSLIFQFQPLDREIDAYTTDLISVIQYYKY